MSASEPPDNQTLDALWTAEGLGPRSTLRPRAPRPRTDLPDLPTLDPESLALGITLGEGGTAVVRTATQRTLGREVAVKMLRPGQSTADSRSRLLHEAFVTAGLEHPNVVPAYEVGQDRDGNPYLVLRRVDGEPWSNLIAHPERIPGGAADPLDWHLRTLLQVCHAVAFAHARGVLHRDLKPDNVMIGAYGEVYLVDWGLAVALPHAKDDRIPRATDAKSPAGTPAYLAPEQLAGREVDERTDVYLLGATLYELTHGLPPHQVTGESGPSALPAILERVRREDPPIDPTLPAELRRLLAASLARDPAARPASAEAFREALAALVAHRSLQGLLDRAAEDLAALEVAAQDPPAHPAMDGALGACRFAYARVLEAWPESLEAADGLRRSVLAGARWHLGRGEWQPARALLTGVEAVPPELVDALVGAERRHGELQRLVDTKTGIRTRMFVLGAVGGAFWSGAPAAFQFLAVPSWRSHLLSTVGFTVIGAGFAIWARDSLSRSELNRRVAWLLVLAPLLFLLTMGGGWQLGLDPRQTLALVFLPYAGVAVIGAAAFHVRFALAAVGYAIAFLGATTFLDWGPLWMAGANAVAVGILMSVGSSQLPAALQED